MIISYSGRSGAGKDLAGQITSIILNNTQLDNEGVLEFLRKEVGYSGDWNIKKWSDKLKDIVCLLLNCTREQLEDVNFKEKELGEEWDIYRVTQYDFEYIIKYDEYNSYPIGEKIYSTKEGAFKDAENQIKLNPNELNMDFFDEDLIPQKMTPRLLLQILHTECGRNIIHPNLWVNALMSQYKIIRHKSNFSDRGYMGDEPVYPNWIITDTRFPNELKAVKDKGGITIRINREPEGKWVDKQEWDLHTKGIVPHESETALDDAKFDYVIENNGTIRDLIEKIREILIKEEWI